MKLTKECFCVCKQLTKGGTFLPGHDQKFRTRVERAAGGPEKLKALIEAHLGCTLEEAEAQVIKR